MGWSGSTPVLSWKDSVRVATAAALPAVTYDNGTAGVGATLTADAVGVLTVDGIATVLGDRILVKNQVAGLQNGPYDVTVEGTAGVAAVLTRSPLSDEAAEVPSEAVFVQEGTANGDSGYTQTANAPVTMGTTVLVYVQFTGLGMVTAGDGMTKTGNTLDVVGGTGITVNANNIEIDATVATASDTLAFFAATTSAELLALLSDPTGTGLAVFGTAPTLDTPVIASFASAAHDHSDAAGGAKLTNTALTSGVFAAITGIGTQAQALDMNTNLISNLAAPVADNDAARKAYVDALVSGVSWKDSVRVATAAALPAVTYDNGTAGVGATLTADAVGVLTVDGVATVLDDKILVKNQVAGLQNGIYDVTTEGTAGVAAVLTRCEDSDEADEMPGSAVFAEEGTANDDSGFVQTVNAPITMGTTALSYTQFTGLGQITAGDGMTKSANVIDVIGGTGIDANANDIAIDSTVVTLTGSQTLTNKTLTTPFISEVVGSSGAAGTLTLRATSDPTPGAVICEVEPGVRAWTTLATGEFLVGASSLFGAEIVLVERNQNAASSLTLRNTTNDTAASTGINFYSSSGGTEVLGQMAALSPSFTEAVGLEAGAVNIIASADGLTSLNLLARSDVPILFKTDGDTDGAASERARVEKGGLLVGTTSFGLAANVAEFQKNANAGTRIGVENTTDGTSASAGFVALSDSGNSMQFVHSATSFTPAAGINANEGYLWLGNGAVSMALITQGAHPIRVVLNSIEEAKFLSGGGLSLNIGVKSLSATEIGVQVTNAALTIGSLGSVILPVKADAGAPNDAAGGNLDGAVVVNTSEDSLYYRSGGTWKKVDKQLEGFTANDAIFLSTPAGFAARNGHAVIAFDDGGAVADEQVTFEGVMSNDYSGGDILVDIDWVAVATTGDVVWGVEIERDNAGGHDIDADSFDTQQTSTADTTDGTSGIITRSTITLTNAEADVIAAGDAFRLRLMGLNSDGGHTIVGDSQVLRVSLRQ